MRELERQVADEDSEERARIHSRIAKLFLGVEAKQRTPSPSLEYVKKLEGKRERERERIRRVVNLARGRDLCWWWGDEQAGI